MTEHSKVRRRFSPRLTAQTVSALSVDPAGARFVTGGYDYDCKLFDFGGMDSSMKSFRSWEPCGSYQVRAACSIATRLQGSSLTADRSTQVHDVAFNLAGDHILVAGGTCMPKLYDRDAHEVYVRYSVRLADVAAPSSPKATCTSAT